MAVVQWKTWSWIWELGASNMKMWCAKKSSSASYLARRQVSMRAGRLLSSFKTMAASWMPLRTSGGGAKKPAGARVLAYIGAWTAGGTGPVA